MDSITISKRTLCLILIVVICILVLSVPLLVYSQSFNSHYKISEIQELEYKVEVLRGALDRLLLETYKNLDTEIGFQEAMDWTTPVIDHRRVNKETWLQGARVELGLWSTEIDNVDSIAL